tara:strand:+ start:8092 stop:8460 length:369 start_codon:yes stop_codon:yes gene_type:complete
MANGDEIGKERKALLIIGHAPYRNLMRDYLVTEKGYPNVSGFEAATFDVFVEAEKSRPDLVVIGNDIKDYQKVALGLRDRLASHGNWYAGKDFRLLAVDTEEPFPGPSELERNLEKAEEFKV